MKYEGKRVLVLEGYARQSLPFIRSFKKSGCEVSVLCSSKLDAGYASRFPDNKILGTCDRERFEETEKYICDLIEREKYDLVVPMADFSANILSKNKEELKNYSYIVSNKKEVFEIAKDKLSTMKVCMENAIPCPYTLFDIDDVEKVIESGIEFPIVVKPRVGYGAIGFKKVENSEQLRELFSGENNPSDYVFQEYIPQTDLQYECAMFIDSDGEVKTSLVFSKNRWFPVDGGSSTLNITVDRPDIVETCSKLLKKIGWQGPADIDLIQDPRDNTAKVMEINPRVSGSVKICFVSGVDQAKQMLEMASGEPVTEYKEYKIGQRLRCSQTDLLWFIKSPDRFKSKPSFFSIRRTKDQTFYWDDPLPWFAFSLRGLKNYKKEMNKRR